MTSGKVVTTLGFERRNNPALQFTEPVEFGRYMLKDQPTRPANSEAIVAINQGRLPYAEDQSETRQIDVQLAGHFRQLNHSVIDVRSSADFVRSHVPDSVNIQLTSSTFEQSVGWIVPGNSRFFLVAGDPIQAQQAVHKLCFIGMDQRLDGFLFWTEWADSNQPTERLAQIDVSDLRSRLGSLVLLDVREPKEWFSGHVPTSKNSSYRTLNTVDLPFGFSDPVAVMCAGGARSSTACSILKKRGYQAVHNVKGGLKAWIQAGYPVQ